ncbi:MAG: dihydrolipoamide acetyltransferase family protein [Thiolinea sp.]
MNIFTLPDLGEGLPDAEIVEWHVQPGDNVEAGQLLVSVETAKAIIDVPSPHSGQIAKLYGKAGDVIETGKPLVAYAGDGSADAEAPAGATDAAQADAEGMPEDELAARHDSGTVVGEMLSDEGLIDEGVIGRRSGAGTAIKATPAVRALAGRMGVELAMVTPSGRDGTILSSDVRRVARILAEHGPMEPLRGVRRAMARNMTLARDEVSSATVMEDADITGIDSTADITPRLMRAIVAGCKAEPSLNAWYDGYANGRRVLERIHLGLAVDAPQGLFVAVFRDIQQDDEAALKQRLDELKDSIARRSLTPDDMRGASILLSNYGAIVGKYASLVVLPPTVAILGAGRAREMPVVRDGEIVIRRMLPLALSFDHRAVTGGEAARFVKAVIEDLQG